MRLPTVRTLLMPCLILLAGTSLGACASGSGHAESTPPAVAATLAREYPGATVVRGGAEDEDGQKAWEVILHVPGATGERTLEVTLALDGTVLSEEERMKEADLPAAVAAAVKTAKGPDGTVKAIERSVTPATRDNPRFEVLLVRDGRKHELLLDGGGRILNDEVLGAKEADEDADKADND